MSILASEQDEAIKIIFDCAMVYPQSNEIKLQLTIWAMQNDLQEQCSEWISEIQSQKFGYIKKSTFDYQREVFPWYCKIVYVLAYCEEINLSETSKACLLAFKEKDFSPKDRGYFASLQLTALINTLLKQWKIK
jgi:hypothetical protein